MLPKDWYDLLSSLPSPEDLKVILTERFTRENETYRSAANIIILPQTFITFVKRRHDLVQKLKQFGSEWIVTPETLDLKSHFKIINLKHDKIDKKNMEAVTKMCRRMSPKKLHEVVNFSSFIHQKFDFLLKESSNYVIDIGSGLGYLDQFMCEVYNYRTIAIESSANHGEGAKKRNEFMADVNTR